jgi:hypothetical protein
VAVSEGDALEGAFAGAAAWGAGERGIGGHDGGGSVILMSRCTAGRLVGAG